jgi:hypothetical protein
MCETTYYLLWNNGSCDQWLDALSLPLQPWSMAFLELIGLSNAVISHIDIWNNCFQRLQITLEHKLNSTHQAVNRGQIVRLAVIDFFKEFSELTSREIALEIDYWVRIHFYDPSLDVSLRNWRRLLFTAYDFQEVSEHRILPPDSLTKVLKTIPQLVSYEELYKHLPNILNSAKEWINSQPLEIDKDKVMMSVATLNRIIETASILKALNILANQLNFNEVQQVVEWAYIQSCVYHTPIDVLSLRGDRLIQETSPCHHVPSILDLPCLDNNILA